MVTSLGRRLYNLTARLSVAKDTLASESDIQVRADTALIWMHAPMADASLGLLALARRLIEEDGLMVVLTCPVGLVAAQSGPIHCLSPADTPVEVGAFLDQWQPRLIVISDGEIRPTLIHEAAQRRIPVLLVDAQTPYLPRGREGWYPGLMRESLASLHHVMSVDDVSERNYRKAGAVSVQSTGRLEEQSAALPCLETERAALADMMATRPIWLAAAVSPEEEAAIISAHRATLRHAHRLLLILVPQDPARAPALAQKMESEEGWLVAQRGLEEDPETDVEVYLPDSANEYGLWYRLAPITFLGGSLAGKGTARNPMEAAALGSAILHGPRLGVFGAALGRLGAARAARAVATAQDLADALADLLSPDRSARYAQAAWSVTSEGSATSAQALDLIRAILAEKT